jgi:O-antigen ligase
MNQISDNTRLYIDVSSYFLVVISLFFLPVSTSLNALFIVAAFLSLFGHQFRQYWRSIITLKINYWALALLFMLLIGVFYSSAYPHDAMRAFKKYGHRLFAFMVLPPLFCRVGARKGIYLTLILSALVFSLLDLADRLQWISIYQIFHKSKMDFLSPLPFSLFSCLACLLSLHLAQTMPRLKWLLYGLAMYFFVYVFFINMQRTAMLVLLAMGFIYLTRQLTIKQKLGMIIPAVLVVVGLFFSSSIMRSRFEDGLADIKKYQQGEVHTPWGTRIGYITHSWLLIKQKPLRGYGTGSFSKEYGKTGGPFVELTDTSLGDPHNSFVHLWVQIGLVGMLLYVAWLTSQWRYAKKLPFDEGILLRCFLAAFIISSLTESAFYRSRNASLYMTMAVVCIGSGLTKKSKARALSSF